MERVLNFYNLEAVLLWTVFVIAAIVFKAVVEIYFRNPSITLDQFRTYDEFKVAFKLARKVSTIFVWVTLSGLMLTIGIDTVYRLFWLN